MSRAVGGTVLAAALAILGLGLLAEWAAYGPHGYAPPGTDTTSKWVLDLVIGCSYMVSGALGTWRRPDSLVGPLLMLTAAAWFVATLIEPPRFGGTLLQSTHVFLYRGFLAHAIVTFPSGRPSDRVEWAAVLVAYATAILAPLWEAPVPSITLSMLLVLATWRGLQRAHGVLKHARRTATSAAVLLAASVTVTSAVRALGFGYPLEDVVLVGFHAVLVVVAVGLVAELIRSRGDEMTDQVVDLGGASTTTLAGELSRLLGDPSVRIWTRSPSGGHFLDESGRIVDGPVEDPSRTRLDIDLEGQPLATLTCAAGALGDPGVRRATVDAVRLAAVNARLHALIHQQLEELSASRRRLVLAGDAEGERLANRVRDGVLRHLSDVRRHLVASDTQAGSPASAIEQAMRRLEGVEQDLRDFAAGLAPLDSAGAGLEESLARLARESDVPLTIRSAVGSLPPQVANEVYLICSEAVTNVSKHARASSATIAIAEVGGILRLEVSDDGAGGASMAAGSGLRGLADRVASLGGSLSVTSDPGRGTTLIAVLVLRELGGIGPRTRTVENRRDDRAISLDSTDVARVGGT